MDARLADPVIPPLQFSLGPEPITEEMRVEEKRKRQPTEDKDAPPPKKPRPNPARKRTLVSSEMEEDMQLRATDHMKELGVIPVIVKALEGKRPVCGQLRTSQDKTPDGQIHCVLGRSTAIWCP